MTSIEQIVAVADQLQKQPCGFAFLGGAVLGVLITDRAAAPVRTTRDVDVLVDTPTRKDYTNLEARLRKLGFKHDTSEDAPICRWRFGDTVLDVMPPSQAILGWRSLWLSAGLKTAVPMDADHPLVRIVTPPYYIATKLEAFHGRGDDDFMGSQDLEDVITLINGRDTLTAEIEKSPVPLRRYLAEAIERFLADRRFLDALPGHLGFGDADQGRVETVLARLREIARNMAGHEAPRPT